MKSLLLFSIFVLLSLSSLAQEKYFHELKGIEDSTGTTHLFYRLYNAESSSEFSNHIYHLNVNDLFNSRFFYDQTLDLGDSLFVSDFHPYSGILEYSFINNNIKKPFYTRFSIHAPPAEYFQHYDIYGWDNNLIYSSEEPFIKAKSPFQISNRLIISEKSQTIVFKKNVNPEVECCGLFYEEREDAIRLDFHILTQNPTNDHLIGIRNDSLIVLNSEFELLWAVETPKNLPLEEYPIVDFYFNKDSTFYFRVKKASLSNSLYIQQRHFKDLLRFHLVENKQPIISTIRESSTFFFTTNDPDTLSHLYITDSTKILSSNNFGITFSTYLNFDNVVTGLYKKPNSDFLYVLTTHELFEVNTLTLEKISLKKIPVTNEEEPKETPSFITLHQNYPNPFNPTTTISFELDNPANVTLTVFDALGRTIANLMNERKSTGLHTVNFDASNLSSGFYFYKLEAGGFLQTKRLTLIK